LTVDNISHRQQYSLLVPGTISEGLNGWSDALTVGLVV